MNYEEMLSWVLFYVSIFRTHKLPAVDVVDPAGLVRSQVIERIKAFARRQRRLAEIVQRLTEERDSSGPEANNRAEAEAADAQYAELEQRIFFATKTFQDAERTLRYMCDVPVRLEARFGAYARALEAALPPPP